jgi:hypothetical protein
MVQAIVDIDEKANRVINIVKATHGLRTKSEALNVIAREYEKVIMASEFKPGFLKEMKRLEKEPTVKIKNFRKHFGLK